MQATAADSPTRKGFASDGELELACLKVEVHSSLELQGVFAPLQRSAGRPVLPRGALLEAGGP